MMQTQIQLTGRLLVVMALFGAVFQSSDARTINTKYGIHTYQQIFAGDGGQASAAYLYYPTSCFVNTNGEAFIADKGNYRIRKVDASGIISSLYGSSSSAVIGTKEPTFVTGDSAGNIYFTDNAITSVVSKIDTSLTVSVFAGGGTLGTQTTSEDNGAAATSAKYVGQYLCTDTNGDLYIADEKTYKIKKVTVSTGILTLVAGTGYTKSNGQPFVSGDGGPATSANLVLPMGLFADSVGALYFSAKASTIRKIDLMSGIVVAFAGSDTYSGTMGNGGPATSAYLDGTPYGSWVVGDPDGNIYYCSAESASVRVIDTSGIINAYAGTDRFGSYSGDGGDATAATLLFPRHVYIYDKTLFITDYGNNVVRTVGMTPDPTAVPSVAPSSAPTTITPTVLSTANPTLFPSTIPSAVPSNLPTTSTPTVVPTLTPSVIPSALPSVVPTMSPTADPSQAPTTAVPTLTFCPSVSPTATSRPSIKPTNRPTLRPSRAGVTLSPTARPSVSPTLPYVVIAFNSSLYLHNVSASSLDVTSQSAVTSSVAVTLNISTDQVSYVSQQLIGGTRRRLSESDQMYQIEVTVTVVASTADFVDAVNHNGTYLYHLLTDTLTAAVASNAFTRTVREQSATLGAITTLYVGHVNVTVSDFTDVTPSSVNDDNNNDAAESGLSGGAIAGIVVGGVAVLLCVWIAVCRNRKRENRVEVVSS